MPIEGRRFHIRKAVRYYRKYLSRKMVYCIRKFIRKAVLFEEVIRKVVYCIRKAASNKAFSATLGRWLGGTAY